MLSDNQIQEISKLAADYSGIINMHPLQCLIGFISMLPCGWDERWAENKRCKQWLFDNQQSYPFSITKQDMLY